MELSTVRLFTKLKWIDGKPLRSVVEPYRQGLFGRFFDERDDAGRLRFNLGLFGRAKKNWKTADLALAALYCLVSEPPSGYDSDCYVLANDGDQARDDLSLAKKIVKVNPILDEALICRRDVIERKDGRGFLQILPAGDVAGSHGRSYRFAGFDEIHSYRNWDLLEAMQPDPHRADAQVWITSYASVFHRPGVPLFDLMQTGWAGRDPRMLFSWCGGDRTTDPEFADCPPEERANPSRGSWADSGYLAQQQRRLHDMRRSAVRTFERAGVPRSVAMSIVGHKTESIYRRYAIVDEAMQREAAARLDAFTSAPTSGITTGRVATFTPKGAKVRRRTGSERDQSGISAVAGGSRHTATARKA